MLNTNTLVDSEPPRVTIPVQSSNWRRSVKLVGSNQLDQRGGGFKNAVLSNLAVGDVVSVWIH